MTVAAKRKSPGAVYTIAFMVVVTMVFISAVSGTYLLARERIKRNEAAFTMRAVFHAAGLDAPEDSAELERIYVACVSEVKDATGRLAYCVIKDVDSQETMSYVLAETGAGLWGRIEALVGFERDLRTLIRIDFMKHNETPGLGARITEDWFRDQFRGKRGPFVTRSEGKPKGASEFDAVTGATITSNAVRDILNRAVEKAARLTPEE